MEAGFEMKYNPTNGSSEATFGRCAIREVCKNRGLELGGDLCQTFHYYLGGMSAELLGKPVRLRDLEPGESCTLNLRS